MSIFVVKFNSARSHVPARQLVESNFEIVGVDVKAYGDGIVGSFMKGFTGNDGTVNVHAAYENCIAVLSDILNQAYEISNTADSHI